jgi:hypothetical protein
MTNNPISIRHRAAERARQQVEDTLEVGEKKLWRETLPEYTRILVYQAIGIFPIDNITDSDFIPVLQFRPQFTEFHSAS